MTKRRRGMAMLIAAGMIVGLVGCGTPQSEVVGSASSADAGDTGKGTIVFSTKTITNNEFQRVMSKSVKR